MTAPVITALWTSASVIAVVMLLVWLISIRLKDASIIDPVWGIGFAIVAWAVFLQRDDTTTGWLLPVLTSTWGLRLASYLWWRNHGAPEDPRYQAMRRKWGRAFPWVSLLTVFLLQGIVMWVVSLPIQTGISSADRDWPLLRVPGIIIWATGLFFESVGDWQLAQFKADPDNQGKVLDCGLWQYTRHPNYFGDFLVWWGLYLVAVSQSPAWWTAVGPIVMSIFLMRVSGVTLLEKSLRKSRPGYEEYIARTNAFFPWKKSTTDP